MKKILLIDDDRAIGLLIKNVFRDHYEVVYLENALKGLLWLEDGNDADLIISDIQMPGMDGFEFIRKVKSSGFYQKIPLIMLSGMDSSNDRIKCYELGADDYFVKPFNPKELLLKVQKLMNLVG